MKKVVFLAVLISFAVVAFAASHKAPDSLPENLDTYDHSNTLAVPDKESPIHGIHHFYMNEVGMKTFQERGKEYPDGTIIVGKVYKVRETKEDWLKEGDLAAYTYMGKNEKSESTKDTGGWHFLQFDSRGQKMDINPVKNCFGCHKPHEDTDFVMSTPLD